MKKKKKLLEVYMNEDNREYISKQIQYFENVEAILEAGKSIKVEPLGESGKLLYIKVPKKEVYKIPVDHNTLTKLR